MGRHWPHRHASRRQHAAALHRDKGIQDASECGYGFEDEIHDLRHLHASLLLASGLPLPAVSARLGHASAAVTASIYSHALRGSDTMAADAIQGALRAGGARQ